MFFGLYGGTAGNPARGYAESLRNPPLPLRRGGASDASPTPPGFAEFVGDYFPNVSPPTRADASFLINIGDDGASFGFSANVSRRMRANHGANPKGSKEGRSMNDAQTLVLIHAIAWPILIVLLGKTWNYA
jgi:hypothetical protein